MQTPRGRRNNPRPHSNSFRGTQNRSEFTFTSSNRGRYSYPPSHSNSQRESSHVRFENGNQSFRTRIPASRARQTVRPRGIRHDAGSRQPVDRESQWFRVEVPRAASGGKDFLFRSINASLEQPIVPYNCTLPENNDMIIFHVIGNETAETLRSLSKRITTSDGFKLTIIVKPCSSPQLPIDEMLLQLIRDAMSKRFATGLNYLDLSAFRKDEIFVSRELYVPLDRPAILKEVVKLIQQNIPNLSILNLADNRIKNLEPLELLKTSCPAIRAINLSKNMVSLMQYSCHTLILTLFHRSVVSCN